MSLRVRHLKKVISTGVLRVYFRKRLLQTRISNEKSTGLQTILGRRGITIRKKILTNFNGKSLSC